MIGLKVNGRFLDLKPNTSAEIERKSPFFAISDSASEGFTDTIIAPYTPNNALALKQPYEYYTQRRKEKYDAEYWDGETFRGICTVIATNGKLNLNNIEATEISINVVFGLSNFFQKIKDKKLKDLTLGGVRTFNFTTNNPTDGSAGYWQHLHETWTNYSIPYIFYPVRNEAYFGEDGPDWMNKLGDDAKLAFDINSPLVPMIRVKYLFEQIFSEFGYTLDTSALTGTDWEQVTLVSLVGLQWTTIGSIGTALGPVAASAIHIDLSKHVPQNKTIADFIVQSFRRYGWAIVFDSGARNCRIVPVKGISEGPKKDWTKYANPAIDSDFNEDQKIFAFTNDIDSNDEYPSAPDFSNIKLAAPGLEPTPPGTQDAGRIAYYYYPNQWFQVTLNDTTLLYEWTYLADNIFNDEPAGNTDSIATTISTLPVQYSVYRTAGGHEYGGFFPIMKQDSQKAFGYRTLLYRGMVNESAGPGAGAGPYQYPYASSIHIDHFGISYGNWSNVYHHAVPNSFFDYGIVPFWWADFLPILQAGEQNTFDLYLPSKEVSDFKWDDVILIRNIPHLVMSLTEPLPYKEFVKALMKRLTKDPYIIPVVVTDDDGTSITVFAHLSLINPASEIKYFPTRIVNYNDVAINLYSDAAGTVPFNPGATYYVLVRRTWKDHGSVTNEWLDYYPINSNYQVILNRTLTSATGASGVDIDIVVEFALELSTSTTYAII